MKKTFSLLFILEIFLAAAGCGKKDSTIHLALSSWGDVKESAILTDLCRDFEKRNPGLKVDLQRVPYGSYNSKLLTEFKAGFSGEPDKCRSSNRGASWSP